MLFFRLSSLELALILFAVVLGTTFLGIVAGRRLRAHVDILREPIGVVQAVLASLVALILACAEVLPASQCAWILAGAFALTFLAHGFVEDGVGQEDQPVRILFSWPTKTAFSKRRWTTSSKPGSA